MPAVIAPAMSPNTLSANAFSLSLSMSPPAALLRERQGARLIIRTAASRGQKALDGASALLRQHPVFDFEILARMRHELGVARVIDAFHPDDLLRQLRIVLADMFDQRGLGVGRAGDEDRARIRDRLRDRVQKGVVFGGVPAADRIDLVMNVFGGIVRVQHELLDIGRAEMEHPRFAMIDPDDGVMMMMTGHMGSFAQCRMRLAAALRMR